MNYETMLEETLYRYYDEGLDMGLTDEQATEYAYECVDMILRYGDSDENV